MGDLLGHNFIVQDQIFKHVCLLIVGKHNYKYGSIVSTSILLIVIRNGYSIKVCFSHLLSFNLRSLIILNILI